MSITSSFSEEGHCLTIIVSGRFDFQEHRTFRDAYMNMPKDPERHYVIDMKNATYMDSAALGMLLVLREFNGGRGDNITLKYTSNGIANILDVSRFDQLFNLEHD